MSRKKNRTRRPKAHANNRWGPRTVGFDDHMQGVDPPPTKNHNPANRRGGNDKSFPPRGRGAQPYHNGNGRTSGPRGGQTQRNNNKHNASNSKPNRCKRRNNNNTPNTPADICSDLDMLLTSPPPLPFTTLHQQPSPFSFAPNAYFNGNGGGPNTRFCTECSAVRRANLRFRNWATRAIRACGERFCEWADDAGVGFESADEMDWQPEPVTRVLLVRPSTPNPYPFPIQQQQQQQYKPIVVEQHGGDVGGDPRPGPWPWPPFNWYENPTVPTWSARVPSVGLPSVPTTAEEVPLPDFSALSTNPNTNTNINNAGTGGPIPVSGFGLLGAGCAGCAADEQESRLGYAWSGGGQPPIPARAPPQAPTVISTCGPTRVGVPSTRPFSQSFATYRGRKISRDSDGPY
ncbi:uncharacterized protein GGS22DRAFT_76267 [Annulohypoxylon maeteangense]|uniref:uncharacterized protein n=1 Tax=Annulohypoxylon maeteangense TaxID=1927788 RepID=UPI0020081DD1|nr:uncharacterized protein GGS22DRAFT_76267 [Annulohypoxylon maeteangense]KAI0881138.1 hypothetical protein GGS22DRAFT_76267 [Annulohypoxylon maeteangense]